MHVPFVSPHDRRSLALVPGWRLLLKDQLRSRKLPAAHGHVTGAVRGAGTVKRVERELKLSSVASLGPCGRVRGRLMAAQRTRLSGFQPFESALSSIAASTCA